MGAARGAVRPREDGAEDGQALSRDLEPVLAEEDFLDVFPKGRPGGSTVETVPAGWFIASEERGLSSRPDGPSQAVLDLIADADIVIYDSMFTDDEFPARWLCVSDDQDGQSFLILDASDGLAQSSVYRNLVVLEEAGVVTRIVTNDDFARYELSEQLTHHHHHLICSSCGDVSDFSLGDSAEARLDKALHQVASATGFRVEAHRLDLVGTCSDCG